MPDDKKARIRSPNYPSQGLRTAVDQIEKLFKKIHTHAAPRDVVVNGLGYGSYNGASGSALSAQLKYGLLTKVGEDYQVTDRAIAILHPRSTSERASAIEAAAHAPALFAELLEQYHGHVPDDGLLRANLIRKGFAPSAVAPVIQAFRETIEFLERYGLDKSPSPLTDTQADQPISDSLSESAASPPSAVTPSTQHARTSGALGADEHEFLQGPLSRSVSYRLLVRGIVGPKELGKLIKVLELQKSLLEDDEEESD